MFKHISYAAAISKAFTKAVQKFVDHQEPLEVFKDLTGDLFEARYNLWPKKVQAQVMGHAHFSGKMLLLVEKVRKVLKSEELDMFLEGVEEASKKKMVDDITFATEMDTVGPRQAAINMVARRMGESSGSSSRRDAETREIERLEAATKAVEEKIEWLRRAGVEIPDDEIQINDEELDN
jgi:hypothetical protein